MRGVNIHDMADLAILSEGLKILTGQGILVEGNLEGDTTSLWVEIQDFIVRDQNGSRIGVFTYDEDTEDFVYVPRHTTKQDRP